MGPVTVACERLSVKGRNAPVGRFLVKTRGVLTGRPYYISVGGNVKFTVIVLIIGPNHLSITPDFG